VPLYFDSAQLPSPVNEYVAWVDVMGTQASMSRSLNATANFIFKLHAAALQSPHVNMSLYPVMDGLYAASPVQVDMMAFLRKLFEHLADEFASQANNMHRFLARGALAFGPVVHGRALPAAACRTIADCPGYQNQILLGISMVQSHMMEPSAPPFGVAVHESARSFAPPGIEPLHAMWWKWRNALNGPLWDAMPGHLDNYFDWYKDRSLPLGYALERIKAHQEMGRQYFSL